MSIQIVIKKYIVFRTLGLDYQRRGKNQEEKGHTHDRDNLVEPQTDICYRIRQVSPGHELVVLALLLSFQPSMYWRLTYYPDQSSSQEGIGFLSQWRQSANTSQNVSSIPGIAHHLTFVQQPQQLSLGHFLERETGNL